jgi:hypothetical protein
MAKVLLVVRAIFDASLGDKELGQPGRTRSYSLVDSG